jgi:hypothetical protein
MCCKDSDFLLNVQANQDKLLPNGTQLSTMLTYLNYLLM